MTTRCQSWIVGAVLGLTVPAANLSQAVLGPQVPDKAEVNPRTADTIEVASSLMGIRFAKPNRLWTVINEEDSGLPKLFCMAEESDEWSPRFAVLAIPSIVMPNGMESRLRQVKVSYADNRQKAQLQDTTDITASKLRILKFEKAMLAGREAMLFVYEIDGEKTYRTVEYGIPHQDYFYIVQAAAPTSFWDNPESASLFERSFKSFTFLKSASRK